MCFADVASHINASQTLASQVIKAQPPYHKQHHTTYVCQHDLHLCFADVASHINA